MLMGSEVSGKPGELSSLHYLQVPKPDVITVPTAISRAEALSPFLVGMKVTLLLPLCSPFHYMAKGRGNSQQHLAQAMQQCGGPSEELPEGQRQEAVRWPGGHRAGGCGWGLSIIESYWVR